MRPQRIQLRRTKGWRKPEGAVVVSRPSRWGNPFRVGELVTHHHRRGAHPYEMYADVHQVVAADQAVRLYREVITNPTEHFVSGHTAPTLDAIRRDLAGRDLACWCPLDQPCHADVLLELANGGPT